MAAAQAWTCPRCSRRFAAANQSHSCGRHTVRQHLEGRTAAVVAAYREVERFLTSLPGVRVEAVKTRIAFKRRTTFASVQVRRDRVTVSLALPGTPSDARFVAGEVVGDLRVHGFDLHGPGDLDDVPKAALRTAYDLAP